MNSKLGLGMFGILELLVVFGIVLFVVGIFILYFSLSDEKKVKVQKQKKNSSIQNTKISREELQEIVDNTKELVWQNPKETTKIIQHWLKDKKK
ncbi:MAG: hypothetical protein ACK4UJ_02895 [Leptonema sp. (in: bacteria)]